MNAQGVLHFWFTELKPKQWFMKNPDLDREIERRFLTTLEQAAREELHSWRHNPAGRLAEILVLDQFSRNVFRDLPRAFAQDSLALRLAQEAVDANADRALAVEQRPFMYMPFMHSESVLAHEHALKLFAQPGLEYNLEYERRHKAIIDRFGRFPHRNVILGRASTAEESEFLKEPGSSF